MKDTFDLQDELLSKFIADKTICQLLNITDNKDIADCINKIRREIQTTTLISNAPDLFFSFVFIPSVDSYSANYLVGKSTLEFVLYGKSRSKVKNLYKAINSVLKDNYEDMRIVSKGQIDSEVTGIYSYLFRVKPLTTT